MKRILKMTGIVLISIIVLLVLVVSLFINLSPQFGQTPTAEQKKKYAKTDHYEDGKFVNRNASPMNVNVWKGIKELMADRPNRRPKQNLPAYPLDSVNIENHPAETTQLSWFGHSTFLLQIDGKKILIDPMFGEVPSPHPWLGQKRYSKDLPIEIEKLPFIDAVILSHDHYDHLDYNSIRRLKGKVGRYFTPLGVGNHLSAWGVEEGKISELDWWENIKLDQIELVCTPARHFSGRGLFDRAATLWASWVIQGKDDNIFFSGDSGYDTHFKEIGEKYGPFDLSLMECGQYNQDWQYIHMMPEETALAAADLKSKLSMPIHWGAFTLAYHDWMEPVERMLKKAEELNLPVTTPRIGEKLILGNANYPNQRWWNEFVQQ